MDLSALWVKPTDTAIKCNEYWLINIEAFYGFYGIDGDVALPVK